MSLSRLKQSELLGVVASAILIGSLFMTWYSLDRATERDPGTSDWLCGDGTFHCTAFGTFKILDILLIAAASAPLILAWIVIRGHTLSWPPGQLTMVVGLSAAVLILFNGVVKKPGEIGVGLSWGYLVGLLAAIGIGAAGIWRSYQSGGAPKRKPPGVF